MSHPIQTGNVVLIILGVILTLSGPYITYRTVIGMIKSRNEDPKASLNLFSNSLNFLIAVIFFLAGILFVVNNLKGNPLAV
jgi:di/tricarboxylate transporter